MVMSSSITKAYKYPEDDLLVHGDSMTTKNEVDSELRVVFAK
jgi:hypothetical protein